MVFEAFEMAGEQGSASTAQVFVDIPVLIHVSGKVELVKSVVEEFGY